MMIDFEELQGEAAEQAWSVIKAWSNQPVVAWPEGTEISEPHQARHWVSRTCIARLPNGHWYELLLDRDDRPDPREVPPVIYAYMVDPRTGDVYAYPRIANMSYGMGAERIMTLPPPSDEEEALHVSRGAGFGLERRYKIGTLARVLRERTRTVTDGWGY